jgi:hypothetical protein
MAALIGRGVFENLGAHGADRTRDLSLTKGVLYH